MVKRVYCTTRPVSARVSARSSNRTRARARAHTHRPFAWATKLLPAPKLMKLVSPSSLFQLKLAFESDVELMWRVRTRGCGRMCVCDRSWALLGSTHCRIAYPLRAMAVCRSRGRTTFLISVGHCLLPALSPRKGRDNRQNWQSR